MGRYITTKADFTLRKKHKKGPSGTTIYEHDYTTINPMPNALKGEYVIGDSNFVFTSRLGINGQRKHVRGKFVTPSETSTVEQKIAWTLENMPDTNVTDETKIRLKPNYTSIRDFACYGSAVKLVQGTVNGVITDFPAEMYLSNDTLTLYKPDSSSTGYSFNDMNGTAITESILYNEYGIDITSENIQTDLIINPLRYLALCGSSYTYIENGIAYDFVGFSVTGTSLGTCNTGKRVWVDKLAEVDITFISDKTIHVNVYRDYKDGATYYTYTTGTPGACIRPKKQIIEKYFQECDDFTAVLLDRTSKPIYTSVFETPRGTDKGYVYEMLSYIWPSSHGGFNPDLSGAYYTYLQNLIDLGEYYDEHHTDNMWRSLTHEAIKALDWTYISNTDGDVEDMSVIDTSRVEPITKIYGRQFDDLKRYIDGIKTVNTITYNQKSNIPDYNLTDVLANSGWETKTLKITGNNDITTKSLYPGLSTGYTASDANNEFMRRMKLNSQYLISTKGTRKGLDAILSMFGFEPEEYDIHESVCVFGGNGNYPHFCNDTDGKNFSYPLAKDVETINKYKINFDAFDPYGDYCGIPVAEIGYFVDNPQDPEHPFDYSYVVPWFSQGKKYDDGLYFQMHGGWQKKKSMEVNVEVAKNIHEITDMGGLVPLYGETQARLKFASDFDDLIQEAYSESHLHDVFYVTDISEITTKYVCGSTTEITDASHYFVLETEKYNQFLGYSVNGGEYGWRSITLTEITGTSTTAGTLVLYLESIKDDTTGNNPHIGNGTYDDGSAYIQSMSQIFNYSLENKNFIGIDSLTCGKIAEYIFNVTDQEDNRKCWYFTDDYNDKKGKTEGENIQFREIDVTSGRCMCKNGVVSSGRCTEFANYDITDLLATAGTNAINKIGTDSDSYMLDDSELLYMRTTYLEPFDPEKGQNSTTGESAANSIVNVKKLLINFNLEHFKTALSPVVPDWEKRVKEYIETSVIPYLSQMIPSTTILEYRYSIGRLGKNVDAEVTGTFTQTDNI